MYNFIKRSSAETPDPGRSLKNLQKLLEESPEFIEEHKKQIHYIAGLFSYSQFLADYSINNPDKLSFALNTLSQPITKQKILLDSYAEYGQISGSAPVIFKKEVLKFLRELKKRYLLVITLRDICGLIDLYGSMSELTSLAEAILELALDSSFAMMKEKFGDIRDRSFCIIGLGKLGAQELNYSSDIDIVSVYRSADHISSGIASQTGLRMNRIDSHEYFCRLTELLTSLLQSATEDGIAYRVDMRLRPSGQKGDLSHSLKSYSSYYEAWGKTWERMVLIRARPITGDILLGNLFIVEVEPFVWKRSIDYNDIDEIREMKNKIDTVFDLHDIKRGYGGIREIEFFVQTFQLLYGGELSNLRSGKLTDALEGLFKEGILGREDVQRLSESYTFMRKIEHILQMKEDLQTHTLPSAHDELTILARKIHFSNEKEFSAELRLKRLMIRDMYNSLLGPPHGKQEVMLSLDQDLPEEAVFDYLSFKGFKYPDSALKHIKTLNENINTGKTIRQRNLLRKAIPLFLQHIVQSENKDTSLSMFVTFMQKIENHESYIDLLLQRNDTREIIISILSSSTYFTRLLLSLDNIEGIFEYPDIRMDYKSLQERLRKILNRSTDSLIPIREFKSAEDLKSGMLFLKGFLDIHAFTRTLSMLADAILNALTRYLHADSEFAVIGFGGLGASELNIGSDLDLLFISTQDVLYSKAEDIIRFLSEYTAKGVAYKVDMRLRPDGSKGILLNNIKGYETYYLKSAHLWEIQSLLRARPIAGDRVLLRDFQDMKRQIIIRRGGEITGSDMKDMRKKIIQEIVKKPSSYDIKHGIGGIKEIEFLIQYLQMKNASRYPDLIEPNTPAALKNLLTNGIVDRDTEALLSQSYTFLRTIETLLRLNEMDVLKINSNITDIIIKFMNIKNRDELIQKIEDIRQKVIKITDLYYS
jgi:glutamate-ammonia-ligase adenylyltransferase